MRATCVLAMVSCAGLGQTPSAAPAFEAASVRPAAPLEPDARRGMNGGPGSASPGQIDFVSVSMKRLLMRAYGVTNAQVVSPSWLDSERYDIHAKLPAGATNEQFSGMLRNLSTG